MRLLSRPTSRPTNRATKFQLASWRAMRSSTAAVFDAETGVDDATLRDYFVENRARFVSDYEATQPELADGEEAPAVTFDLVQDAVAEAYRLAQAENQANQAASEFVAYRLYDQAIERDSACFNATLNEAGLSLTKIEPFTAAGAKQRALSPQMLEAAFDLSDQRYFSDAYAVPGGFAVLIYQDRIEPEIPGLMRQSAEVEVAYLSEEKRRLFNENGEAIQAELTTKLKEGTGFKEAADALGLSVAEFESFSEQ